MSSRRFLIGLSVFVLVLSAAAFADNSRERTQWGHNVSIGTGEEADEVTCFGCSVHIRGHVNGDVTTFGGSIIVEDGGEIGGDATTFAGTLRLDPGTSVGGDVTVFGGRLQHDPSATIGGDTTDFRGGIWLFLIFGLPCLFLGGMIALVVWFVRKFTRRDVPVTAYTPSKAA
jgi:hypothetical protein